MLLTLIATVAAGLGAAGLAIGLGRLLGWRPRWLAPVTGGLAMFAFVLWSEYSWFDRARAALPEGARIAETYAYSSWLQPWTVAVPRVARFAAVVTEGEGRYRRARVILAERLTGTLELTAMIDCAEGRRAALAPGAGTPDLATLDWSAPDPSDALVSTACQGAATG